MGVWRMAGLTKRYLFSDFFGQKNRGVKHQTSA